MVHDALTLVVDTNVLVPSLYSRTPLAERLVGGEFLLCLNPEIVAEVQEKILALETKVGISQGLAADEVLSLFAVLETVARELNLFAPSARNDFELTFPDPDDRCFLWTAKYLKADFMITGDEAILRLGHYGDTVIGRLNDFWAFVSERQRSSG